MSFLSSALGAKNTFSAAPATGNATFQSENLQPAINTGQTTVQNQIAGVNGIVGQQQDLASQLKAQSMGAGPNIADLQLKQATDRNNQQAAGMLASQRGLNPALAARLIAQNQASNNQTAAGQSGLMRAQQQLASEGQLANVYGQAAGETLGTGTLANQNLTVNQNALQNQNSDVINANNAANSVNAGVSNQNAQINGNLIGGVLQGAGSAAAAALGAKGGKVHGGKVPAILSPGERYLNAKEAAKVKETGENPMKHGKVIPGKANVPGDSLENDVVPAHLEPGGVVLPRSVTQSQDNASKAKEFMSALKEHNEPGPKGFAKILEMKRKLKEMHGHLEDLHDSMKDAQ